MKRKGRSTRPERSAWPSSCASKWKPKRFANAAISADITAFLPEPDARMTWELSSMHRRAAPPNARSASVRKTLHQKRVHRG